MEQNPSDYKQILLNAIPYLKYVPSCSGSEGRAYFLSDDLVIKEYLTMEDWTIFDSVFTRYCSEIQNFANMGFNVPKIYAWEKVPNMEFYTKGQKNRYKYYILEERVKGRELYLGYIEDAYSAVKDICSKEEFKEAVKGVSGVFSDVKQTALVDEILKRYFQDYVTMNEMLEAMPKADLSKFLTDAYQMYLTGEVSYPDIFPLNIFAYNNKLTMIDLHVRDEDALLKLDSSDYVKDIVNLFLYNYFVTNPSSVVVREKIATNPELEMISKKNESLCKEVLKKTIGIINSDCDGAAKRMTEGDKALVSVSVGMVLDGQDMGEVLEMFN